MDIELPEPTPPAANPAETSAPKSAHSQRCVHSHCNTGPAPKNGWQKTLGAGSRARFRTGMVLAFVLLIYCGLSARLVQIQVTQSKSWKQKALQQKTADERVAAQRGPILDAPGLPLAYSMPADTVIADLKLLTEDKRDKAAESLAPLLKIPAAVLRDKMDPDDEDRRVVYLARNVDEDTIEKIRALKIRGIGFEDAYRRTYPQGQLACHLVGWSGIDGGKEGLELELNEILSGTPGYVRYYRDAAKRVIALDEEGIGAGEHKPPRDGIAVTLTIDSRIQQTAEEELLQIHEQFQPKSATCVIMDCQTGAILAMACTPTFDPNNPAKCGPENRRNRCITDIYEPGSTFKSFMLAMSLEKKIWRRNEIIDCENGAWHLGYRVLHDAHAYGLLSVDDVIAKSSNIGAAKIGCRLGLNNIFETVKAFGFGELTGVNLPGEVRGRVRPRKVWSNDSIYSVSMGHEIGVTPLQLVAGYAAMVNGGTLVRPKIVQRLTNDKGEELYTLHPQQVRRVISEQTSKQMRDVLTRVVAPGGTGFKAFCPEWPIGGKTGTTKKIDPATKTYSSTLYIGSFCGFAPADNPRVVCLVTVDEPHKGAGYYGGTVACPAVREVIRKALTVLNVPPRSADEQRKAVAEAKQQASQH